MCKRDSYEAGIRRSSNWMLKRFSAAFQSRIGLVHVLLMLFRAAKTACSRPLTHTAFMDDLSR